MRGVAGDGRLVGDEHPTAEEGRAAGGVERDRGAVVAGDGPAGTVAPPRPEAISSTSWLDRPASATYTCPDRPMPNPSGRSPGLEVHRVVRAPGPPVLVVVSRYRKPVGRERGPVGRGLLGDQEVAGGRAVADAGRAELDAREGRRAEPALEARLPQAARSRPAVVGDEQRAARTPCRVVRRRAGREGRDPAATSRSSCRG